MPQLPNPFTAPQGPLASYDSEDLSSGTGYVEYYCANMSGSKVLTNIRIDSNAKNVAVTPPATGAQVIKLDFDLLYNKPQTIKGDLMINVSEEAVTGGNDVLMRVDTRVLHVSEAAAETELSNFSGAYITIADPANAAYRLGQSHTIAEQHFKKGEKLRVSVEAYSQCAVANASFTIYCDAGGNGTTLHGSENQDNWPTDIKVLVPYRIEV